MITALDVANTFLTRSKETGIPITPMKLQKLLYFFYKTYLKEYKIKAFEDLFEVWQYGPVIPTIYYVFKKYEAQPIRDFYYNRENHYSTVALPAGSSIEKVFNKVWKRYALYNGVELSRLTHQADTAWDKARLNRERFLNDQDIFDEREL